MATKNEAPTTVTEQVGRDFDPKNASGLYNKSKPLGPSAAGVSFGMIPYKTATGTREIPGVIFPALPKKQGGLEPAAVAPTPMSTFTPEEQAKADATYQKAFPVVSAADKGIAAADVEARVAAEKAGTPMPKTPSVFEPQSKTAMPAGISPAVEGTIPTAGKYTQMGEQNFAKYDTPTEFGIIQNAGPNEKALTPDAKGNFDWKKIRGMDNVTLTASAMNLTPEKQAEVDRKRLMSEYEGLTKKYGVGVPTLRAYEKRLGIGNQMTEAQRAANVLERDKMKQALDLAEADRNMKEEDKIMQIALALSPTVKTKDVNDMEEKITETKDLSIYEAMLKDGSIKGKAGERLAKALEMVKSKQRKVLKPGDVIDGLRYKGGDPKKEGNWEKE